MGLTSELLTEMAVHSGLDLAGAIEAKTLVHLRERLELRRRQGRTTNFEETEIERRIDPTLIWPEARSIIAVGSSYLLTPEKQIASSTEPRGKVARCAQGLDYHLRLEYYARNLVNSMKKELPAPLHFRILIDRNPLVERELAVLAGLGLPGVNCNLITPSWGSYVALGAILIDQEVEPSASKAKLRCLNCGRCREACPTGALVAPYIIDPARCLSYLTQCPGVVPEVIRPLLGNLLYGCDRCQEVCPYNQGLVNTARPEGLFPFFPAEPRLIPILSMTRKEFSSTIALTAAGWRGKTTLQRNAVIALGNLKHREAVAPLIRMLAQDPRPVIRLHAAWSLGAIGGARARFYLEKCRQQDPHGPVREEARKALENTE